jgi:hypothetical protein
MIAAEALGVAESRLDAIQGEDSIPFRRSGKQVPDWSLRDYFKRGGVP